MMATVSSDALPALGRILEAVREATGYPEVLDRIARAIVASVGCDRTTVYIHSRRRRQFLPAAEHGTPPSVVEAFLRRGYGDGTFPGESELIAGRSVAAMRGSAPDAMEEILRTAELHSLVVVPVIFQGEGEGALSCGWHSAPGFTAGQVTALEQLAPHIALLIRTSRLEAEHARLAERRRRLATWAADVLAASDFDTMAMRLCEATRALFLTTRSALFLLEDGALVPFGAAGPYAERVTGGPLHLPPGAEPGFDEALRTREVLVINDFRNSPWAETPIPVPFRPAAALVIPLHDDAGTLGLLTASELNEPFRFGPAAAEDARLLGTLATVAIRKALLVEALKRADRAKSEFLANVTHDLRTPLNVFLGYTQLLAEGAFGRLTEEQTDTLGRMERSARGQLALINDLLDLARIEQGKLTCHRSRVDIGDLVTPLREMMDALLRGRPIDFEVDIAPEAIAHTDPDRVHQVLVNVLGNAAKFTLRGSIRLDAERRGDAVEIAVSDTGPGIEAAFTERATEPFVRGETPAAGAGLGLAIVARLLRVLGGGLSIDSAPGHGTTVRILLPAEQPAEILEITKES